MMLSSCGTERVWHRRRAIISIIISYSYTRALAPGVSRDGLLPSIAERTPHAAACSSLAYHRVVQGRPPAGLCPLGEVRERNAPLERGGPTAAGRGI